MRGRPQAVLVAALLAFLAALIQPANYLAGAAVGLVTLRHGVQEGLLVGVLSGLLAGVLGYLIWRTPAPGMSSLLAVILPVVALATVLRRTVSLALTVEVAGLIGVAIVAGMMLLGGDMAPAWREQMEAVLRPAMDQAAKGSGMMVLDPAQIDQVVDLIARNMAGIIVTFVTLGAMAALFIARWWQAMLYNPGGFRREFHVLRLSKAASLAALVVIGLAMVAPGIVGDLAMNMIGVAVAVHLLAGIALVHGMVGKAGLSVGWLVGVYVLLVLVPQVTLLVLAVAGFMDSWVNIRNYVRAGDKP